MSTIYRLWPIGLALLACNPNKSEAPAGDTATDVVGEGRDTSDATEEADPAEDSASPVDTADTADTSDPSDPVDTGDSETPPVDLAAVRAALQAWFEADTTMGPRSHAGLTDGTRLDTRDGDTPVAPTGLAAEVEGSFGFYARLEAAGLGTVRLDEAVLADAPIQVVTAIAAGGDAYVEAWLTDGTPVIGARFFATEAPVWDGFEGRVRLAERWTAWAGFSYEEGLSEDDERSDAGQVPYDWTGELQLTSGQLIQAGSLLGEVQLGSTTLTDEQRDLVVAAFELLWSRHLQYRADGGVVRLGPAENGVLTIGSFTRSTDGETYQVADWRDIDDGSFVLYFEMGTQGLELRVLQSDN